MAKGILDRLKQRHRLFIEAKRQLREGKTLKEISMSTGISKGEIEKVLEQSGHKADS